MILNQPLIVAINCRRRAGQAHLPDLELIGTKWLTLDSKALKSATNDNLEKSLR